VRIKQLCILSLVIYTDISKYNDVTIKQLCVLFFIIYTDTFYHNAFISIIKQNMYVNLYYLIANLLIIKRKSIS